MQAAVRIEDVSPAGVGQKRDLLGQITAREVRILTCRHRHGVGADREGMDSAVAVELVAAGPAGQEDEVTRDVEIRVVRLLADLHRWAAVRVEATEGIEDQPRLRSGRSRRCPDRSRQRRRKARRVGHHKAAIDRMDAAVRFERVEAGPGMRHGRRRGRRCCKQVGDQRGIPIVG